MKRLQKYGVKHYAVKERKIEKSDLPKYRYRSQSGKTAEASNSDCILESREVKEEIKEPAYEEFGKEIDLEAYKKRRPRISEDNQRNEGSDQGRCKTEEKIDQIEVEMKKQEKKSLKEMKKDIKEDKKDLRSDRKELKEAKKKK